MKAPSYSILFTVLALGTVVAALKLTEAPYKQLVKSDLRSWRENAIKKMWNERKAMGHTPLVPMTLRGMPHVDLIFKDESMSRTFNLKHRFAWALFMWALVEGFVTQNTTVYEASSGNTACSEAFMAQKLGIPFVAVIPETTEAEKVSRIEKYGGKVLKTQASQMFSRAAQEAQRNHGFYMNQFANADMAEEYHATAGKEFESMNVMHEIVEQLKLKKKHAPDFFVHSAGTGGTISSVGRFIRKQGYPTNVVMADTQYSIYYDFVVNGKFSKENGASLWKKPGMAGTGFGYSGPAVAGETTSLRPNVIDIAYKIPDLASTAAMHVLRKAGIKGGTSTGVNFVTALSIAATTPPSKIRGNKITIVPLIADKAELYEETYYNKKWIDTQFAEHGGLPIFRCWENVILNSMKTGKDPLTIGAAQCKPNTVKARGRRFAF